MCFVVVGVTQLGYFGAGKQQWAEESIGFVIITFFMQMQMLTIMLPQGTSLLLIDPQSLASDTTFVHNSHNFGRSWRFTRGVPKTGSLSPSVLCCDAAMRPIPRLQPRAPMVIEATRPTPRNARIIAVGLKFPGVFSLSASVPMLGEGDSEAYVDVEKAWL